MNNKWLSLPGLALYAVVAWLPALVFVVFKDVGSGGGLFHLVFYNLIVLVVLIALGVLPRRQEGRRLRKIAPLSLVLGAALGLAAFVFIHQTNIQIVQANLYHNAARSSLQQKRYDQAISQYRRALALDPGQGLYQLELAQSLVSKAVYTSMPAAEGDRLFRQAEDVLLQAVTTNPFEPYNRAQLAEIHRIWSMVSQDEARQAESRRKAMAYLEEALQYNKQNILFLKKWAELQEAAKERQLATEGTKEDLKTRLRKMISDPKERTPSVEYSAPTSSSPAPLVKDKEKGDEDWERRMKRAQGMFQIKDDEGSGGTCPLRGSSAARTMGYRRG